MLTGEKRSYWQLKTTEGITYQPDSSEALIQWIFENRIGSQDYVFSPGLSDWVPLCMEPLLERCFWNLKIDNKVYGPVSIGELKQLFLNNEVTGDTEISSYAAQQKWIAIQDLPSLYKWLQGEYTEPFEYEHFLSRIDKQFTLEEESTQTTSKKGIKLNKRIDGLEDHIKTQEEIIEELKSQHKLLEKEIEKEKQNAEELKLKLDVKPEILNESEQIKNLKSEIQEKGIFIDELNKQMAQMEAASAIRSDEIKELNEQLDSSRGTLDEQLSSLSHRLQEEHEQVRQLIMEKELLQEDIIEKEQLNTKEQKKSEQEINKLNNDKEGLQNFIYSLQEDLAKINSVKEHLKNISPESADSFEKTIDELIKTKADLKARLAEKDKILKEYKGNVSDEIETLRKDNKNLNSIVGKLNKEISLLEERQGGITNLKVIKDAQIKALLDNKDRLTLELEKRKESVKELKQLVGSKDEVQRLQQEGFSVQLKDLATELKYREETIKKLENELNNVTEGYQSKIQRLDSDLLNKEEQYKTELNNKLTELEVTLNNDKLKTESIHGIQKELDQIKAELEFTLSSKEQLSNDFISQKEKSEIEQQRLLDEISRKNTELESYIFEKEQLEKDNITKNQEWENRYIQDIEELKNKESIFESTKTQLESTKQQLKSTILEKERFERELNDKVKEWENRYTQDIEELRNELSNKEYTFTEEKTKWEDTKQELLGEISLKKTELESMLLDKEQLADELTLKIQQWENRYTKQTEEFKNELKQKDNAFDTARTGWEETEQGFLNEISRKNAELESRIKEGEQHEQELLSNIDDLENKYNKHIEDIRNTLTQKESDFDTERETWGGIRKQLESILLDKEQLVDELTSKIQEWENKYTKQTEEFKNELKQKDNAFDTARTGWEETEQGLLDEISRKNAELESRIKEGEQHEQELLSNIDDLESKYNKHIEDIRNTLTQKESDFDTEKEVWESTRTKLQEEKSRIKQELEHYTSENEILQKEIGNQAKEWETQYAVLDEDYRAELERKDTELDEEKKKWEDIKQKYESEINDRNTEIESLKSLKDKLQNELNSKDEVWETKFTQKQEEFDKELIQKKSEWETRLKEESTKWEEINNQLENELNSLKRDIETKVSEREQLERGITQKIKQWGEEKQGLLDEISIKSTEIESLIQEKGLMDELKQQLEGDLSLKKTELESISLEKEQLISDLDRKEKEWENTYSLQKDEFAREIESKMNAWEIKFNEETRKWEDVTQQLEGELAQRTAEIEAKILEKQQLEQDMAAIKEDLENRLINMQEKMHIQHDELTHQKDRIESELTSSINDLQNQKEQLQRDFDHIKVEKEGLLQDKELLNQELTQRERFIEEIKRESLRQAQILNEREQNIIELNNNIQGLHGEITNLTTQLQNELDTQNNLRGELSSTNENLDQTKTELDQLRIEKDRILEEIQRQREDYEEVKRQLQHESEEMRQNWENAIEEGRNNQREFYSEKQRLTKEYTETINKQSKIEKRNSLEREITDRNWMKEEMQRLYNLIKGNLEGLDQGGEQIQSAIQQIDSDIENRRLSAKYIYESDKRGDKKGKYPKPQNGTQENNPQKDTENTPQEEV